MTTEVAAGQRRFRSDRGPIAVVGCGFRMPGAAGDEFWDALIGGRSLVSSVAADRWAQEALLHPRKSEPGTAYTFAAGSIGDIWGFDAAFFGISPREAAQMDPQQRLLLEMTWEAFESALIPPSSMRGSRCGVFVGLSSLDHAYRYADDLGSIEAATMTGNTGSIAANRISYIFDLRGPSLAVDTACSSSLVALHQACQSIRHGETDAALAAGISLHLHPYPFIGFSKASMLSRHGRCAVFDEEADGYVRSEGGAVLLLKPLAQAIADGNRVLAVVAETGVNSDGRKNGLTVPSHSAQAALLREVYERAGIPPLAIDYFEAHGTGTTVGDPIEALAIGEALGRQRPGDRPLPIGSVKGNVGHLEAAAGMAGLVKSLYVLRHRRVPANLHLTRPSSHIDFAGLNLAPVTQPLTLDAGRRIIVGVSAFGFGGTNAHAVLTSYEAAAPAARPAARAPLLLSARSAAALGAAARSMGAFLRERTDVSEYDVAWSALFGRDIHPHRLLATGEDRATVAGALERFAESGAAAGVLTGRFRADASPPVFVYSGNGSQWVGMGVQLLDEDATFRAAVEEVDALLRVHTDRSVIAELRAAPAESRLDRTEIGQPALFAIQVGLTRMLERAGVRPAAVCGHSVGEVAAAWASGALSLESAVRVIHERAAHQALTRGQGAMTAVELGEDKMGFLLAELGLERELVIAAENASSSVTVAGDATALAQLETVLARREVAFRRLALEYAFHSRAMDAIREGLLGSLTGLVPQPPTIPLYSTVTGAPIEGVELASPYWWRNVREPVRFAPAIRALLAAGLNTFIEIGPRPVLIGYLNEIGRSAERSMLALPSLTAVEGGARRVSALIGQLELSGALKDPSRLFPVAGRLVELPHYPWRRERLVPARTAGSLGVLARHIVHPLLGYRLSEEPLQWENHLDTCRLSALADHTVGGACVFPAAGFVEMALAAGAARRPGAQQVIEDLEILAPLVLERDHSCAVRLRLDPDGTFTIVSRDSVHGDGWRTHAVGRLIEDGVLSASGGAVLPPRPPDVPAEAHYALTSALGLDYGPAFRSVSGAWMEGDGLTGSLVLPECAAQGLEGALLHPALLDGAFQLLIDLARRDLASPEASLADLPCFLPVRIGRLELARPGEHAALARVRLGSTRHRSRRALLADFSLHTGDGAPIALASGVRFRAASVQRNARASLRCIAARAVAMPRRDTECASAILPTVELAQLAAQRMNDPKRNTARLRYAQEVEPLLDALCGAFAERALRSLSGVGETFDPARWHASGAVSLEAESLLDRLIGMLAEDGVIAPVSEGCWRWTAPEGESHFPEPADIWMSLLRDYPEYAGVTARLGSAGLRLPGRLREGTRGELREQSPAESAFWWLDGATHEEAAAVYGAIDDLIGALAASQRPQARLRVLRIASAAPREELAHMLWPLPDRERCELHIAAPTQQLLDEVRRGFAPLARQPGHVLDLDQPADSGGGGPGHRFDVIILGEGFSDAPDPELRLARARALLSEGGLLLAIEQPPSRAADLVFGLHPAWWRAHATPQARAVPRWRPAALWNGVLARSGFGDPATISDTPRGDSGPFLLIARADHAPEHQVPGEGEASVRGTWLLLHDEAGDSAELSRALVSELEPLNQRVLHVIAGSEYRAQDGRITLDPASAAHWTQLLTELERLGSKPDGWIHLAGLDLKSAGAAPEVRAGLQRSRGQILVAWLQSCARSALRPACWVVGAQAGLSLLPPAAQAAIGGKLSPPPDRLRDAVLWGLARVAMQEFADLKVRWVDLLAPLPFESSAAKLAREFLHPDAEDEILLTAEGRFVPRLDCRTDYSLRAVEPAPTAGGFIQLDFLTPGPFRNLKWRRREAAEAPLAPGELEIEVRATGLNFRDVMYAMGLLPDEAVENGFCGPALGIELAGVVVGTGPGVCEFAVGDEVMGLAPGAFATRVRTPAWTATPKPRGWSLTAAATVPTAFFTAYYSLVELARLRKGERLLIHGAAGGVGIAAVQIARHLGAEVFATAGSPLKRDFVTLLGADHVFDSRSLSFSDEILGVTGGEGVDVVLNSLAGEAMRRTVRLLKPFGRMLELGKRDFYENSRLSLRPLRNNVSYFAIDAEQLLAARPDTVQRCFAELRALFAAGVLSPLPHQCFPAQEVEAAFRHMQPSRHIGKIVVTFDADFDPLGPELQPVPAPTLSGLSGFGLATASWLVERGARHLALLGRRGSATPDIEGALASFQGAGAEVRAIACDVSDVAAVRAVLADLKASMPPLRGVVHAAMVIEDALIKDLSAGQLERVLAPKVAGALALHQATAGCELDFFVLYSSATTLFGNPGQGAYVAANLALEALAAERRSQGLAVTCVGFGPIADVGYLARNDKVREALVSRIGGRALTSQVALEALGSLLEAHAPTVGLLELDWSVLGRFLPASSAPKFSELARTSDRGAESSEQPPDVRRSLEGLTQGELVAALTGLVRTEIAQILRTPPERIDTTVSLFEVGMDSLMAVELATSLEARLGVQLSAMSLSDGPTIERIAARIARQVRPDDESGEPAAEGGLAEQVRYVAAQHASEVSEGAVKEFSEEMRGTEAAALSGTGRER
jgi:phthiocerol/phenolphthiocerol synthesis type-I polyketide synthase C